MFTAENEDVLVSFQALCEQYPRENPVALWEMAGGQTAAEQSVRVDKCPSCLGTGCSIPNDLDSKACVACDGTGICQ